VNDIDRGAVGVFSRDGRKGDDQQGTLLETSGIIVMAWDLKDGKQHTWLTCMLHLVSYRGANEDPLGDFCLIFYLKKIDFSTAR